MVLAGFQHERARYNDPIVIPNYHQPQILKLLESGPDYGYQINTSLTHHMVPNIKKRKEIGPCKKYNVRNILLNLIM